MRERLIRTTFEEVKHQAKKAGICPVCGKKASRQHTFMQTLNPFNKDAQGQVKDRRKILDELYARAKEWKLEPTYHVNCEPKKRSPI